MYYGEQTSTGTGINITSGTMALRMPDVGEKQGEISVEFEMLHKASDELRGYIGQLESRLSAVLRPSPPTTDGNVKNAPEPVRTPLAETIHQRNQDILSFSARIGDLLNRIEL